MPEPTLGGVHGIRFADGHSVHIKDVITELNHVSTDCGDALEKIQARIARVVKSDDVAALHGLELRESPTGEGDGGAVRKFVKKNVVADEDGSLHGTGGHERSLSDEGVHEECGGDEKQDAGSVSAEFASRFAWWGERRFDENDSRRSSSDDCVGNVWSFQEHVV
jgi:hypothetical protein